MEINLKAAVGTMLTGLICTAGGYIAGHASAMHQHATVAEQKKVLIKEDGTVSTRKYICEAFKDYKRMQDDPLGLHRELN